VPQHQNNQVSSKAYFGHKGNEAFTLGNHPFVLSQSNYYVSSCYYNYNLSFAHFRKLKPCILDLGVNDHICSPLVGLVHTK